ncbi:MAG TPA: HTH-type transcriptional activator IlvY, partial [Halomonas sp.]|nr:HTH-type transcriptional activator IlvY [Halomonas sp.]
VQILNVKPELPHYDVGLCVLNRRLKNPMIDAFLAAVTPR